MARHDDGQRLRGGSGVARERVERAAPPRLRASTPRATPGRVSPKRSRSSRPSAAPMSGDVDVELEVAGDRRRRARPARRSRAASAVRLRGDAGERREHRPRQRGEARIAARRSLRQARVDEEERHAARRAQRATRLGQSSVSISSPARGRKRARNASHRERHVVGQPRLHARDRRTARARPRARSRSCA